jgi:hypothetical protein
MRRYASTSFNAHKAETNTPYISLSVCPKTSYAYLAFRLQLFFLISTVISTNNQQTCCILTKLMYNIYRLAEIPFSMNTSYVIYRRSKNERPRGNGPGKPNQKGQPRVSPKHTEIDRNVDGKEQAILDELFLSVR